LYLIKYIKKEEKEKKIIVFLLNLSISLKKRYKKIIKKGQANE